MIYKVSPDLFRLIDQVRNKLMINFFYSIFLLVVYALINHSIARKFDLRFIVGEILVLIIISVIQYSQVNFRTVIIGKTAIEVDINDDFIFVKTAAFKALFFINNPSKDLKFKMNELMIRNDTYHLKEISKTNQGVIKLVDNDKEAYILIDFFEKQLEHKLRTLDIRY